MPASAAPSPGLDPEGIDRLRARVEAHVAADRVVGVAWSVSRGADVEVGAAGVNTLGEAAPVARDTPFRISSMTKPIVAVAALVLVEQCRLRLDDPVDDLLPELADRQVLVDGAGPVDGPTVPAARPITVRDVLTFRLGLGMDFTRPWPQPLLQALAERGLGGGPPAPQGPPEPDEWMARLGELPLQYQPGERWLYHVGADVLGVLVSRAMGQSLDRVVRELVLDPLGMADTGFTADPDRLGTCYGADPTTGERVVYDPPDGQWASPPAFPSGGAGLVSTVGDYSTFARMLFDGGRLASGDRLLSRPMVELMTTDQVGVGDRAEGPSPDGSSGWGFGVGVTLRRTGLHSVGSYGWAGGMGSIWSNDPAEDLAVVVMTTDMMAGPFPPPAVIQDVVTAAYGAIAD